MQGMGGLFELIVVFAILIGWGFIELRSTRRDKKAQEQSKDKDA